MIKILRKDGRTCPVFSCDVCQERITGKPQGMGGMVKWDPDQPEKGYMHFHKGACDELHERQIGRRVMFWQDLDLHVIYLKSNLGLTKAEWKKAEERASISEAI